MVVFRSKTLGALGTKGKTVSGEAILCQTTESAQSLATSAMLLRDPTVSSGADGWKTQTGSLKSTEMQVEVAFV